MTELFNIASYYIQGKPVYPALRRMLNLLFNISIASFIYEKCYGSYSWLNITDYKSILDFFIKGNFFIPFSIFVVVYGVTQFMSSAFFSILNHFKSVKIQREILQYQYKKDKIDKGMSEIHKASKYVAPMDLTPELMLKAYQELRKDIKPEVFQELESGLKEPKQNLEANFNLAFRALIAITLYFISLPQFGWILFTVVAIVLLLGMYILILAYRLLDIIPTALRKFHTQAEMYLQTEVKNKSETA